MKRALAAIVGAAFVLGLGYAAWMNPDHVEVHFTGDQSIRAQLGLLMALTFLAGAAVVTLSVTVWEVGRSVGHWRRRRLERRAERIDEWYSAGAALTWDGQTDRARALLLKAFRRRHGNSAAALALVSSYVDTGELAAAQRVLEEAIGQNTHDPGLRFALGDVLRRNGDTAEAIRIIEAVRVQHPRAARALLALRDLYQQAGRWSEAVQVQEVYVGVLSNPPRTERERLTQFRYQAAMGIENPAARVEALSALLQSERQCVPAQVSLGDALVANGKTDEALKLWERAFREAPRTVLMERLLAHLKTPRDRQQALGLIKKQRQPLNADSVHALTARIAIADGNLDLATTELRAIADQASPASCRLWARLHRRRQQTDQALTAFAQVADRAAAYHCTECGRIAEIWTGQCVGCHSWDSCRSVTELAL